MNYESLDLAQVGTSRSRQARAGNHNTRVTTFADVVANELQK
jgi:hypothetical protein